MPPVSLDAIKSTFFVFGFLSENATTDLVGKIRNYGPALHLREIPGQGLFYFTDPFYTDVAEDEQMVWIKLGTAHDSGHRYSTRDMMQKGWLDRQGIKIDALHGSLTGTFP